MRTSLKPIGLFIALIPGVAQAQPITTIPFDSIPEGTQFAAGAGSAIELQGDTEITGQLAAVGEVSTNSGVRFGDGTLQTTAAGGPGASANAGLYDNRIPNFSPPLAYTEICFKAGAVEFDIHGVGEPTAGGSCLPGDIGWIIERFERAASRTFTWTQARALCLMDGMRLPEPFEWQLTCDDAPTFAVDAMDDNSEWASNAAMLDTNSTTGILGAAVMGNNACSWATRGAIGQGNANQASAVVRCVR